MPTNVRLTVSGKYEVRYRTGNRQCHGGTFDTEAEAVAARDDLLAGRRTRRTPVPRAVALEPGVIVPCTVPGCPDPLSAGCRPGDRSGRVRTTLERFGMDGMACKACYNSLYKAFTKGEVAQALARRAARADVLKARGEGTPAVAPRRYREPVPAEAPTRWRPSQVRVTGADDAKPEKRYPSTIKAHKRPSDCGERGAIHGMDKAAPRSAYEPARTAAEAAAECVRLYRGAWPGLYLGKGVDDAGSEIQPERAADLGAPDGGSGDHPRDDRGHGVEAGRDPVDADTVRVAAAGG